MKFVFSCFFFFVVLFNLILPTMAAGRIGDSIESFGIKLFKDLASQKQDANLLVFPYSISTGLAMTYNGARGDTKKAMAAALGFGAASNQEINNKNQATLKSLASVGGNTKLQVANALFARQGVPFKEKF